MGPRDMIRYISYRLVEIANDRVGQILIAAPISFAALVLSFLDASRPNELISTIRLILLLCVGACIVFIINLDFLMALSVEDRARIFRTISFFNILTIIFTSLGCISIYSTYYGIVIRAILAIFILGSFLTKTNTLYMKETNKEDTTKNATK